MNQKEAIDIIREFARQSLDISGILEEQKEFIWAQVEGNDALMKVLARRSFDELAMGELYNYRNVVKREFIDGRETPNETKRSFAVMMATKSVLDFFYCGSKPIGDCTREELQHQAGIHKNRSAAEAKRADIFDAVARKIKEGETVRQRVNDVQLARIIQNVGKRQAG